MSSIFGFSGSNDIGIDLGTGNTLLYVKNKGIVLDEPSFLAITNGGNGAKKLVAAGGKAKEMLGKVPESIAVNQPLRDGVISDFEAASTMLGHFLRTVAH